MARATVVGLSAAAFLVSVHATRVYAQHGSAKPPHAVTTQHGSTKTASPHAPTSHAAKSPGSTHTVATKHTTAAKHGAAPKSAAGIHTKSAKTTSAKSTTAARTSSTGGTGTTQLTPVQQKLARNTHLASKLQSRLPAGTNVQEAAAGFRNLGQFVAAVNVSRNLDIPFDQLKASMVTQNRSLGQSIQQLRPASDGTVEARRAEHDATTLIAQTTEPATTAPKTTTSRKHAVPR